MTEGLNVKHPQDPIVCVTTVRIINYIKRLWTPSYFWCFSNKWYCSKICVRDCIVV